MSLKSSVAFATALLIGTASLTGLPARAAEHDGEQLYPLLSYRTGPYAPSGIPQWGGIRDYLAYLNAHGGVDGVKIFVQECETAYTVERAFECYERTKNGYAGAPVAFIFNTSSGFDAAVSEKARADKIAEVSVAGGREDAVDGSVFPYTFPLLFDYWTESSIIIDYIAKPPNSRPATSATSISAARHRPRSIDPPGGPSRTASARRRNVIRVSSEGRPRRSAKPGHSTVPLFT